MELYSGYLPTKHKVPLVKFKDAKTLEQVSECEEYAGILSEQTLLLDIDDKEEAERLLNIIKDKNIKCNAYRTRRGIHFIFLNNTIEKCYTHTKLAIGLTADIKVGKGGKKSIEVLKVKGKVREQLLECDTPDEFPFWLYPVHKKTGLDLFNLGDGDGRNQALFNYILTLQSERFTKEQIKDVIKIINQYIFIESLDDREIETITRDEAFEKPNFFDGKSFRHDIFGDYLMNTNNIIKLNGQLHIFNGGVYIPDAEEIEGRMIDIIPNLRASQRTEVMKYLNLKLRDQSIPADPRYIAFKNGILDLDTEELLGYSPDIILTNKIDFNYNPDAESDLAKKTLSKLACNDEQIISLLEECAGYMFYRRNELRKMFVLIGDGLNGKSTYIDMIQTMLGESNTSELDLQDIGDRFRTAELFGTLANVGDDIDDVYISSTAILKKVISGDSITVEKKGEHPFSFKPYTKLVFSANTIPRIKDVTGAVLSRMIIIPFNARFTKEDPDFDPFIKFKLRQPEHIEYLIKVGIQGLKRVLKNNEFTKSEKVDVQMAEYESTNNPITMYINNLTIDDFVNRSPKETYFAYVAWCDDSGVKPVSAMALSKKIKQRFPYLDTKVKRINGKSTRVYYEKDII